MSTTQAEAPGCSQHLHLSLPSADGMAASSSSAPVAPPHPLVASSSSSSPLPGRVVVPIVVPPLPPPLAADATDEEKAERATLMKQRRAMQKKLQDRSRDRSGREQDRSGRQQDRSGRKQDRSGRQQPGRQKPSGAANREGARRAKERENDREYKERVKALRAKMPASETSGCRACPCLQHFGLRYVAFKGQQLRITAGEYAGQIGYALDIPVFCTGWLTVATRFLQGGRAYHGTCKALCTPCHAPCHGKSSGRRFCESRMYCASPACGACCFDESRATTVDWKLPVGADGMLAITEPRHHYRVQLHERLEPVFISPYHVEPFPQTLDHAYDLAVFDLPIPDARMVYLQGITGDECTVEHFVGASLIPERGYLGHYRCTRTVYAKPEHVQCAADADTKIRSISDALAPGTREGLEYSLAGFGHCKVHEGSFIKYNRIDALSEAPSSWAGRLRVGARARLLPPHECLPLDSDAYSINAFVIKAICKCGECVELEHTFLCGHDALEPLDGLLYCPGHHAHKCPHLGHRGSCVTFAPPDADEDGCSSEPEECLGSRLEAMDLM